MDQFVAHGSGRLWSLPYLNGLELFRAHSIRYGFVRHMHEAFSIGVIEDGVGGNRYRGASHISPPNSLVVMNPSEVHTGYPAHGKPLSYRMMYVSSELFAACVSQRTKADEVVFSGPVLWDTQLTQEIRKFHALAEGAASGLELEERLIRVLAKLAKQHGHFNAPERACGKEHRAVQTVKAYLEEYYRERIYLRELEGLTGLQRSHLIRVFRETVGLPPYEYLSMLRVRKAKKLVLQGDSLCEVALSAGFADQSHLTRFFKRFVGVTPGRYAASQHHSRRV